MDARAPREVSPHAHAIAFAIKTQPADRASRGRGPGPVRHGLRLRLVLVRPPADTPDIEDHDVGAVPIPVLAGVS